MGGHRSKQNHLFIICFLSSALDLIAISHGFGSSCINQHAPFSTSLLGAAPTGTEALNVRSIGTKQTADEIFDEFSKFLQQKQAQIIAELEFQDGGDANFSNDKWGLFEDDFEVDDSKPSSGGMTRVIQEGNLIEKGACSLTIINNAILSEERAKAISGRSGEDVKAGDTYSAAALSIVLHTRSPMVPTFRSDVRIFLVRGEGDKSIAWFGGGADLTPYYIFDEDHIQFHKDYKELCEVHFNDNGNTHAEMKDACDKYFYLPARKEHRGTGGIFFDDMPATFTTKSFVQGVANSWMPSWIRVVSKRRPIEYTNQHKEWQLLRRGRYLEFNLLYDRGVKFGLAGENPRVEGVMVSAPPLIRWTYNYKVEEGSEEERLMKILKTPLDWANL